MIITAKPYRDMSLPELRADFLKFAEATKPGGFAEHHPKWHATRETIAIWIARREREAAAYPLEIGHRVEGVERVGAAA